MANFYRTIPQAARGRSPFRLAIMALLAILALSGFQTASALAPAGTDSAAELSQAGYTDLVFTDPFGDLISHTSFKPRLTDNSSGQQIENTSFGIRNPDMSGGTCFGVDWSRIYHAGEDLYAAPASSYRSTQNAEVRAVADGVIKFAPSTFNYPGLVVIIEHSLRSGQKVYSLYAHLKGPLNVKAGQQVQRGQLLGKVMYFPYTGRNPQYHPSGDDSHLHFEIRLFYNGAAVYPSPYTYCNNTANIPGVGYTFPIAPDQFPGTASHYLDPYRFISSHQHHLFVPFSSK